MKLIDNFLDKDLIMFLEQIFVFRTPHIYGHYSAEEGDPFLKPGEKQNNFYMQGLSLDDALIKFLILKLKNKFIFKKILRCYINVQFKGMDGHWHIDDGNQTIMIMVTKTLKKGSGEFQIQEKGKIKKIDFVQNRAICFEANLGHRGMSPKELNTPRITLVFKTE